MAPKCGAAVRVEELAGASVVVAGAGVSGLAAARTTRWSPLRRWPAFR